MQRALLFARTQDLAFVPAPLCQVLNLGVVPCLISHLALEQQLVCDTAQHLQLLALRVGVRRVQPTVANSNELPCKHSLPVRPCSEEVGDLPNCLGWQLLASGQDCASLLRKSSKPGPFQQDDVLGLQSPENAARATVPLQSVLPACESGGFLLWVHVDGLVRAFLLHLLLEILLSSLPLGTIGGNDGKHCVQCSAHLLAGARGASSHHKLGASEELCGAPLLAADARRAGSHPKLGAGEEL
mmetsp:Transcript_85337/g.198404  ORF Transcript_85337/g.198404 Transcript_85337/m.198404 type:complete len:242 (-) Transcript_85337:27-752(-)